MKLIFSIVLIFSTLTVAAQVGLSAENHLDKTEFPPFFTFKKVFAPPVSNDRNRVNNPVPLVYSYDKLAFFCKVEVKLENAVKFPVKFRLGSVDYVDRLEGKRD